MEAFSGNPTTLYAQAAVSALISIIGMVAAVLVKGNARNWGICLIICGIVGVIAASGFYVGGLLILVAGILAVVRKDQSSEDLAYLSTEQDVQTLDASKTTERKSLAFGPYALIEPTVENKVTKVSPGAYAVGARRGNSFYIQLVGRSDVDVKSQLRKHIGKYELFKFEYFDSAEAAFTRECELYHTFNQPQGRLTAGHPQRPANVTWQCPDCNVFESQDSTHEE